MKYEQAFKISKRGFLTRATVYKLSGKYLVFVEITEICKNKHVVVGNYVDIVDEINNDSLLWVCQYGSKYEATPKMTTWDIMTWGVE